MMRARFHASMKRFDRKAVWLLRELILFARCCRRSRRRGRCAAVAAAGVHDDAGAFPCFNEAFAGVRAVQRDGFKLDVETVTISVRPCGAETRRPQAHFRKSFNAFSSI